MARAQVRDDPVFRQAVVKFLTDRIHNTYALYDDDARRVHLIDSRGCLDSASDWDNELHPNTQGCQKLATGRGGLRSRNTDSLSRRSLFEFSSDHLRRPLAGRGRKAAG